MISYNKLLKKIKSEGYKKTEFAEKVGISQNTLAKFSKNEFVSMEIIEKICMFFDCTFDDLIEVVNNEVIEKWDY